jgi:hypothetical protein
MDHFPAAGAASFIGRTESVFINAAVDIAAPEVHTEKFFGLYSLVRISWVGQKTIPMSYSEIYIQ